MTLQGLAAGPEALWKNNLLQKKGWWDAANR